RMSFAFLLPCITPQMVDFPPIEVSRQIRPQHWRGCAQLPFKGKLRAGIRQHAASDRENLAQFVQIFED
ncbi:hypothetical protein, partial [Rugamonas violacea]|uniref:hypothetical protein n=1 Tax=Rugamonas sp. CCM 8940 TaxID=2765359 RepID=UPI001F3FC3DB